MIPYRRFLICSALIALAMPTASLAWASDGVHSVRAAIGIGTASASARPKVEGVSASSPTLQLPSAPPRLVDRGFNSYSYVTTSRIAAKITAQSRPAIRRHHGAQGESAGASATVVVTAVVLPVHTIVVHNGRISSIYSNTPDPDAAGSLWVVRADTVGGAALTLDAQLWAQVRAKLAHTRAGTGKLA